MELLKEVGGANNSNSPKMSSREISEIWNLPGRKLTEPNLDWLNM